MLQCHKPQHIDHPSFKIPIYKKMADFESPTIMPKLITFLSSLLQRVAESNDVNQILQSQKLSVFHGLSRPNISIQSYMERIFKLLITSVMVAVKFMDDVYYNNACYAKVGGISTTEINFLEVDFLFGLGFHLNVTPTAFYKYSSYLEREMMMLQPHINMSESSLFIGVSSKRHLSFSEDESPHHQQQQLAV
ncbi:cyclin-U4-1-like isoform X2 [Olea europaea var. sylvestris]|uniref:cyclin-U4-1-like isoform X2 n=1 Tax=Olea europaea var. sylvestris TaxID=158386 RepID=UPI000C1D6CC7|nr:cyclin-U4-1-like isoform X2 [Olea europaea var. sylvestris]